MAKRVWDLNRDSCGIQIQGRALVSTKVPAIADQRLD